MAAIKQRGVLTAHNKKYHDGREVTAVKWVSGGKRGVMIAVYKDTGDSVVDAQGKPRLYYSI
jgi:hypothetical protein